MRRDEPTRPAPTTPTTRPTTHPGRFEAAPGQPHVVAVAAAAEHRFSKQTAEVIRLVEGLGVLGDAHLGATDQHRSHKRRDPTRPNLRQVHLIQAELLDELLRAGHVVRPGALGENVTTYGVDLLAQPVDTVLRLGPTAEVRMTGLRNPCHQIDDFQPGLLGRVLGRADDGSLVRRTGVMGVVRRGGAVRPGDPLTVVLPAEPHRPLDRV
jgi:MOSC domain-containing protein YiiM